MIRRTVNFHSFVHSLKGIHPKRTSKPELRPKKIQESPHAVKRATPVKRLLPSFYFAVKSPCFPPQVVFPTRRARCCSVGPNMVPGITLKGPPRPPARRLLPLPLLLLAVMAGKSRADIMGCYDFGDGYYFLSDPSKCWVNEINAAFNGKLDECFSCYDNAVSRMAGAQVRSAQCVVVVCVQPKFFFSPLLSSPPISRMKDEIVVTAWWCGQNELCPQLHSSTPCAVKEGPGGASKPSHSAACTLPAPASIA